MARSKISGDSSAPSSLHSDSSSQTRGSAPNVIGVRTSSKTVPKPPKHKLAVTSVSSPASSGDSTPVKQKKPKRTNTVKSDPYDADKED
ncbi:hypothetical protein BPAE_0023g00080 [Botrytis paeoniae]|uniref:Uncharacterized protein n=1 Tax=Botrytis paeoniae TaxID=278948 RepID=A0A4Z1G2X3_9HELO|nr:hypothetical protein BPAE_0023g00080 [Botrytis paeoniae]